MNRTRRVIGKAPDLVYEVTDEPYLTAGTARFRSRGRSAAFQVGCRLPATTALNSIIMATSLPTYSEGRATLTAETWWRCMADVNNGAGGEYREMERAVLRLLGEGRNDEGSTSDTTTRRDSSHLFDVQVWLSNGNGRSRWKIFNFYSDLPNPFRVAR